MSDNPEKSAVAGRGSASGTRIHKTPGADRLSIVPTAIANLRFRVRDENIPAPHLVKLILTTVLATEESAPMCIILPSVERVTEVVSILAAIECVATDLPETKESFTRSLMPGMRVRLYPQGEVFEVAGVKPDGSLHLLMTDKATYETRGTRFAPADRVHWFEPTDRRHPLGTQYTKFDHPAPNQLDLAVGAQVFGNSGLVRNRILLAGTRAEFERTLATLPVVSHEQPSVRPIRDVFHFGGMNESGKPYVIEPSGAAGQPMVAIERDLLDLEAACIGPSATAGSLIVLTDRIETVMRDLSLAGRIAERQRLVMFTPARRRADVAALADRGWIVWEPTANELLGPGLKDIRIGCLGIDQCIRAAAAEQHRSPGFLTCKTPPSLRKAYAAMAELGDLLDDESVETEDWSQDIIEIAQDLFFRSAGWLVTPEGQHLDDIVAKVQRLRTSIEQVKTHLGSDGALAVTELADAFDEFRSQGSPGALTAKGSEVLRLARTANAHSFQQVFVTGNRQNREEADALFARHDLPTRCLAVRELAETAGATSVAAFSVLRRNVFERLVDPWPSSNFLLVGYDFEIECYRRRLGRRETLRQRFRLEDDARTRLTRFDSSRFPVNSNTPVAKADATDLGTLGGFDRATREWKWARRIIVPEPRQGEEVCRARVVRFTGRSWCAMTDEHEVILLSTDAGGHSSVQDACISDLMPGFRLIIREGSDPDVIRLIAQNIKGAAAYESLRQRAGLWRRIIRDVSTDPSVVRRRLEAIGVRRTPVTIRAWLTNDRLFGPRSEDDLQAIAEAFTSPGVKLTDWKACSDAISELRALHQSAGSRLTDLLAARCEKLLIEPSDTELAVDLGVGTVWLLEVNSVEDDVRVCPASYVNRLQWPDSRSKSVLLASQLREMVA